MSLNTGTSVHRFPESDTSSSIADGAEASNGTAPQSHSQSSIKPFGSAAARFKIRSATTLTEKDFRTKSSFWERGNVDDSSQKSHPSKDLTKVYTSASYTHTNTDDKERGKTSNKDSTLPISSEMSGASAELLNTQEDMSQTASDRSRGDELGRFYQSNKSKSLDWRVLGSRAGHGNTTVMTSGIRDYGQFMRRSNSSEKTETNSDITSTTQDNQPSSRTYNAANEGDQYSDKKLSPVSGCTSLRMNRVNFALERASSGQSLPSRLKPRHSLGSVGEGSSLWEQQPGESSLGQADKRVPGSWTKEQGPCNAEEVTGNQTIKERINKLFGAHGKTEEHSIDSNRLKRSNTVGSDVSFPNNTDMVDSTPRKNTTDSVFGTSTDSQQEKPSYNTEKSGTFPRRFSKTYFGPKQEPSINNENRNDQRDNSSGLSSSLSSKTKWSTEMSSVKIPQSLLPDNNKEKSKSSFSGLPKYYSQSLERTRSRQPATAQYSTYRNQSANSDSNSTIPSEDLNDLLSLSREIKEETEKDKQSDKKNTKRLDIKENRCFGGSQDEITQPKNLFSSKGAAHSEVQKEEKEDVFTLKPEGRRGEGVLEKFRAPSLDSVKNTISMFESLAQQSKGTAKSLHTKRTLSVPEHPKPPPLVKKSDSERNLHYGRVEGNTESPRPNFISNKEIQGTLSKAPISNSDVKVRPTVGCQETYRNLVPEFKQINESGTDQVSKKKDDAVNMTAGKKHIREPDSAITVRSGLRNIGAMEENVGISSITQQSNTKSVLKQQTIHAKMDDVDDDEEENTPTNSPNSAPNTIVIKSNAGAITVNGTHSKVLPNLSHSSTPIQTIYSSLNHSNNNNYKTSQDLTTPTPTNKARWSSDEEDYDEESDTEEDSDSGESSVTITSNMSQSDRRSFSLSYVDLCNYGGVDYKSSDDSWLEDDEELPSSRSASISSDISVFSSVTLLSTDELDRLLDDVRSLGDDTLKKYEDVQVVVLHKEVGSGLGFTLAGGVDQNKPVTVHKIIPGGVAALEGSIFEGARVLSINGTALQNSAHWEALRTLRKAKGQGMAVVVLQSGNSRKEATEKTGITGKRVRLTLNKSSFDLGFSLEGGVGSSSGDKPLTVQKIFRGGPVSEVFPGDELLELQGQSLEGMMRLEAWNLIKKLPPGPVEVLLHRPQQPR